MKIYILAALACTGACAQSITPLVDPKGEPTAIGMKCPTGIICDARSEVCHPATTEYPEGWCTYVGDQGRAFGAHKDGGSRDGAP